MEINRYHIQSPTEVIKLQLGIPQDYKQQCIEEIYRLGDSMNHKSNIKAIMTSYFIWEESNKFDILLDNISNILNSNLIEVSKNQLIIENAWGAIYKKNNFTLPHLHNPSLISFVYYLKSSGNTPLVFDETSLKFFPQDDTLIIFPSHLMHSVPPHNEENDRICIAGNCTVNPEQFVPSYYLPRKQRIKKTINQT